VEHADRVSQQGRTSQEARTDEFSDNAKRCRTNENGKPIICNANEMSRKHEVLLHSAILFGSIWNKLMEKSKYSPKLTW